MKTYKDQGKLHKKYAFQVSVLNSLAIGKNVANLKVYF